MPDPRQPIASAGWIPPLFRSPLQGGETRHRHCRRLLEGQGGGLGEDRSALAHRGQFGERPGTGPEHLVSRLGIGDLTTHCLDDAGQVGTQPPRVWLLTPAPTACRNVLGLRKTFLA